MTVTVQPAHLFSLQDLASLWNAAYEGYWFNVQQTPAQLERRFRATDTDLTGSVVLLRDGAPVGFSILGLRDDQGWIGAFGVVPGARRQGLAHRVLEAQLQCAAPRAPRGIWLEVLEQNHARHLYAAHGFEVTRRLAIMSHRVAAAERAGTPELSLRRVPLAEFRPVPGPRPAWQRDPAAAVRLADPATEAFAVEHRTTPIGQVLIERAGTTARLLHLQVPDALLGLTLSTLGWLDQVESLLLVNEPEGSALCTAAERAGWDTLAWQFEMVRPAGPATRATE